MHYTVEIQNTSNFNNTNYKSLRASPSHIVSLPRPDPLVDDHLALQLRNRVNMDGEDQLLSFGLAKFSKIVMHHDGNKR
jgi:hypothetical protein